LLKKLISIIEIPEINTPTYNNMTDKKRPAKETPPNQTSSRPEPKRSNSIHYF